MMKIALMTAVFCGLVLCQYEAISQAVDHHEEHARQADSDLSYTSYIDSDKRIKCLYGYAADKTGDHAAAIAIFEDCIARWNDVYSMIWLAQIYETGIGVPQDFAKSAALMRRGAQVQDDAAYSRLARYHYGVALAEGRGVEQDITEAKTWLKRAAGEGVQEAADYAARLERDHPAR